MLQNQRACQLVRFQTGCEPLALAVAWGARKAGRCAAGVLGAVKHQRFPTSSWRPLPPARRASARSRCAMPGSPARCRRRTRRWMCR